MLKIKYIALILCGALILTSCQTVSKKIDEKTAIEEKELNKWLNKPESELKIKYGQPDKVEFLKTRNRNYIYESKKLKYTLNYHFEIKKRLATLQKEQKNDTKTF